MTGGVTLEDIVNEGVNSRLKDLHTCLPGIVQKFNISDQTAEVQPAIKRMLRTEENDKEILVPRALPVLINVPVIFPMGGGFTLTFPVNPGDECLLMFCERSIDLWLNQGGVQNPSARRFHSLSDAFAIMGLHSRPKSISNYNNNAIELRTAGNKISIANGLTTLTGNVRIEGDVVTTGNTLVQGDSSVSGDSVIAGSSLVNGAADFNAQVRNAGIDIGGGHQHFGDSGGTTSSPI